jgi:phosphoglucomutase
LLLSCCLVPPNGNLLLQISEIKTADIPDVDLAALGVTSYDDFTVEVIDPVSDYLELMEVYDDINITLIIIFLLK